MSYFGNKKPEISTILLRMVSQRRTGIIRKMWRTRSLYRGILNAKRKREFFMKSGGLLVPFGMALSLTMRCNLECKGCYARFHPVSEEMSIETIQRTIREAIELGVFLFVITGGEPYLREEMISIYEQFARVLFITVTNGSFINRDTAKRLAYFRNVFPMVSIEGTVEQTDKRRGRGDVEPCPFAHFALENVTTHSFKETLRSPFLKAIREHPTALLNGDIGCSLYNNHHIMQELAEHTGARCTAPSRG